MPPPQVRRAADRPRTDGPGRGTRHGFSFGAHYDPSNISLGPLVAHNDELLEPGRGYPEHRHADVEIVTWVVSGTLRHADDRGHVGELPTGSVQVLSAGDGVMHSEVSSPEEPTRFVQSWLRPDELGTEPTYAAGRVDAVADRWVPLAGEGGLPVGVAGAALLLGAPTARPLLVPHAPHVQLFVLHGEVTVSGETLADGDELRATAPYELEVSRKGGDPRVLAWLLPDLRG